MSEHDLPKRIKEYDGDHITLKRIALTAEQTEPLPSFSVETKTRDTRYKWFKRTYGDRCWELDAMDPRALRNLVEGEINSLIDSLQIECVDLQAFLTHIDSQNWGSWQSWIHYLITQIEATDGCNCN